MTNNSDQATINTKRGRTPLKPKPILDRSLLVEALEEKAILLKESQLDDFYGDLHRLGYPSLKKYVQIYLKAEYKRLEFEEEKKCIDDSDNSELEAIDVGSKSKFNLKQLPIKFIKFLNTGEFVTLTSSVDSASPSIDSCTTKLAVRLQDNHVVESVIMRHFHDKNGGRVTICVSSQVGCAMGCTFCATGTMGIRGNLCTGEILEQLVHAESILRKEELMTNEERGGMIYVGSSIRNCVFMGMGEPLNNYKNVVSAVKSMTDRKRWNMRQGRVTVSTVGVTPNMKKLTKDLPDVSLALSLHAPNQVMRTKIVPAAKSYPIEGLIDALDNHLMATIKNKDDVNARKMISKKKRVMIEYVMLDGDTSSFECAHQLGKLCEGRHLYVNLIPYNQTDVRDKLRCPSEDHMREFQNIVTSYGAFCYIRRTMGADVNGACGQLVVAKEKKASSIGDIEDTGGNKKPTSNDDIQLISNQSQLEQAKHINKDDSSRSNQNVILALSFATGIAASCFIVSAFVLSKRKMNR